VIHFDHLPCRVRLGAPSTGSAATAGLESGTPKQQPPDTGHGRPRGTTLAHGRQAGATSAASAASAAAMTPTPRPPKHTTKTPWKCAAAPKA